jgi:phosphoribosylanthranilate isomerase
MVDVPEIKICGITSVDDALMCVDAGASSLGVNLIATSVRVVSLELAKAISRAVRGRAHVVGVVANLEVAEMMRLRDDAELDCLQLHGDESFETLEALLPHAYKAVRVGNADDAALARAYPGDYILVDAKVPGTLGGTGMTFDWTLVTDIARERRLSLAGGLTPDNVADAVRAVRPYCVDVASGVEVRATAFPPVRAGAKDRLRVTRFIEEARRTD